MANTRRGQSTTTMECEEWRAWGDDGLGTRIDVGPRSSVDCGVLTGGFRSPWLDARFFFS